MDRLIEECVADDVLVGLRPAQKGARSKCGDNWRQRKGRQHGGDEKPRKYPQRSLREETPRIPGLLKALRHEKAADRKKHKDGDKTRIDWLPVNQINHSLSCVPSATRNECENTTEAAATNRSASKLLCLAPSNRCPSRGYTVIRRATRSRCQVASPKAISQALARLK